MKNDELLDLVNEKDEVIGTVWKSEAHGDSTKIHREVVIAVFANDGSVLIQQRSKNLSKHPGAWKITASGHVDANENPEVAAKREMKEELGVDVQPVYYKKVFVSDEFEARFKWIYYAIVAGRIKIKINRKEVSGFKWIKPKSLLEFAKYNDWDIKSLSHSAIMELNDFLRS